MKTGVALFHLVVEHGVQTFLFAVEGASAEHSLEHLLRAGGVFDDRALRGKVALQDGDAAVGADGVGSRADDVGAGQLDAAAGIRLVQQLLAVLVEAVRLQLVQILAQRLAGDGHGVEMEHIPDLLHDGRHAAGIVEELCGPAAAGRMSSRYFAPRWRRSKVSPSMEMPNSWAMAGRWSRALVEPEMAAWTMIAFSKLSIVTMSLGRRPCFARTTA